MAVLPPAPVLDQIAALPRSESRLLRFTGRSQWHVTLRFLGHVPVAEALARFDSLPPLAPCEATLGPSVERFWEHVVALPVGGTDGLAATVAAAFAAGSRAAQVSQVEERGYVGHLTLARIRSHQPVTEGLIGQPFSVRFPVTSISLVRSELGQGAPRYSVVGSRTLR